MKYLFCCIISITPLFCYTQVSPAFEEIVQDMPNIRDLAISIRNDEAYMTTQSPAGELSAIIRISKKDKIWQPPSLASFSGKYHDLEPYLSTDGLTLYFASNRPIDQKSEEVKDYDIWYVERSSLSAPWSTPINLGAPINTAGNEFYPIETDNGNIYFTADGEGTKGLDDIFLSVYKDGAYAAPISLDTTINTPGYEFNAYVAPNESFIIYTGYNRTDGIGSGDMYISKKMEDGKWSSSEHMGEINSDKMDYCPFVDISRGLLYFTSRRSGITATYKDQSSLDALIKEFGRYDNGQSRLYKSPLADFLK